MRDRLPPDPTGGNTVRPATDIGWANAIHDTVLPLVVAVVAAVIFIRLDQAREAMFGTIGPAPRRPDGVPVAYDHDIGMQFLALTAAMAFIGTGIWYVARLLLTVERTQRHGVTGPVSARIVELYPRLIGALTTAVLITTFIIVQESRRTEHRFGGLAALCACLVPLAAILYIVHRKAREWPLAIALIAGLMLPLYLIIYATPNTYNWRVFGALSMLCYLPAGLYALFTGRRPLLRRLGRTVRAAHANIAFNLDEAIVRLLVLGIGGASLLIALSYGPPTAARALGSAAIVLLSLTAILFTLCAITLVVRHFTHNRPGYLLIFTTAATAAYLFLHGTFGWSPFAERIAWEKLTPATPPPVARPVQARQAADIVVNAYGGGLRAALFTAEVLADLDDRSCGAFGRRLERMSGVSGGSLGIAVYLLVRQEFVAAGGWADCAPSVLNGPRLARMVDDTLVQDHLSAAMARLLAIDLLPGVTPQRGQALLDSWQDRLTSVLAAHHPAGQEQAVSLAGMALPLDRLNGGVTPAPEVFFNATDVASGKRVWFSNRGTFGGGTGSHKLEDGFQVGQAVLHSARFPFVSPAGGIMFDGRTALLVDGGYADNSGAGTLADMYTAGTRQHWLNIDGNPPDKPCADDGTKTIKGEFSAVDTLFAVRTSQAGLAVDRLENMGAEKILLQPDLDHALANTITDKNERCKLIRTLRTAPLGWYLTPATVGDQSAARLDAVAGACARLRPLCGE